MKEQGYGRIVNITSSAGLRGNFGQTNYGAAKAAIAGMTMVWAIELGKYGITVNAMAPVAGTRMTTAILGDAADLPPDMDPALNAPLVAFLASERAAHVNGQVFGRRGYAYTIFQKYKPVAAMVKDGPWTPEEVARSFDAALAEHMAPAGLDVAVSPPAKPSS
jgi:NAD(P)-dependent dehydrogenase (short-subunit alcohol dehydrogenase family)